jgi:hypothetical protein
MSTRKLAKKLAKLYIEFNKRNWTPSDGCSKMARSATRAQKKHIMDIHTKTALNAINTHGPVKAEALMKQAFKTSIQMERDARKIFGTRKKLTKCKYFKSLGRYIPR